MGSTRYAINGSFLTKPMSGAVRFAREMLRALDKLVLNDEIILVIPENAPISDPVTLSNIVTVEVGKPQETFWEQTSFSSFAKKNGLTALNLCGSAPLSNPGVVCIYDMHIYENLFFYSPEARRWNEYMNSKIVSRADLIFTISEFSATEISNYYTRTQGKIQIIPCAWQHMNDIISDENALRKFGLDPQRYWFAISSLSPNKNFEWLTKTAKMNPSETIVIAGGINTKAYGDELSRIPENTKLIGYITDSEEKALMKHCRGFIFPALYEGFGMAPLEALATGADIYVADIPIMHEIFDDAVCYVDSHIPCLDLSLLETAKADPEKRRKVLDKFSWEKSARKLMGILFQ